MPGGQRPGAGRPKGSVNRRTKELQEFVTATGCTPLEVLLESMRFHQKRAALALKRKDIDAAVRHRNWADEAAAKAAPYVHAKLSAVQMSGGVRISHEEALALLK